MKNRAQGNFTFPPGRAKKKKTTEPAAGQTIDAYSFIDATPGRPPDDESIITQTRQMIYDLVCIFSVCASPTDSRPAVPLITGLGIDTLGRCTSTASSLPQNSNVNSGAVLFMIIFGWPSRMCIASQIEDASRQVSSVALGH